MKLRCLLISVLLFQLLHAQNPNNTYYTEPYRPQFHFTPEAHWMNDPNGLVYYNGQYHLFYQYYPDSMVWGPMHWGHAVSTDLLHWKHKPIALYPDSLGWIFSGSAVIDKENTAGFGKNAMVAIFTYHNDAIWKSGKKNTESQGIAYSTDEGNSWTKYSGNPVLNNAGEQDFRDPKVFWNEGIHKWNMVLAAGDRINIFTSANLRSWQFESDFKPANDLSPVGVWECPDLFPMLANHGRDNKWVLIVNHNDYAPNGGSGTRYFVGDFDGKKFSNTQPSRWINYGTDCYAGVTFSNTPYNKRILLTWMSNWQYAMKVPTSPWRSSMALPVELSLRRAAGGFVLLQEPADPFATIQEKVFSGDALQLPFMRPDKDLLSKSISLESGPEGFEGLHIELSNDQKEIFSIELNKESLLTDRRQAGLKNFSEQFAASVQRMPLHNKITHIQLILDQSSAEIFLNHGEYVMTNLFFPTQPYSLLAIRSGKKQKLKHCQINKIRSVWR